MLSLTCNWRSCTSRGWNHWVCGFPGAEWGEKGNVCCPAPATLPSRKRLSCCCTGPKAGLVFTCFPNQVLKLQYKIITISILFSDTLNITQEHMKSRAAALPGKHNLFFAFNHQGKPDNMLQDITEWFWKFCRLIAGHTRPTKKSDDNIHRHSKPDFQFASFEQFACSWNYRCLVPLQISSSCFWFDMQIQMHQILWTFGPII